MRTVAKIIGVLLLFIALWTAFVFLHKESLDDGLVDFYRPRQQTPPELDAATFLDGLNAPRESDPIAHGLLLENIQKKFQGDDAGVKQRIAALGKIDLSLDVNELDCWIYGPEVAEFKKTCASPSRLRSLLKENSLLLSRYQTMTQMSSMGNGPWNGQLFLNINKLLFAQILLEEKSGKAEQAYQHWYDNFSFLNRVAGGEQGWVGKAIILVAYGFSQKTLETLLHDHPDLTVKHERVLLGVLSTDFNAWNLEGALRGEHLNLEALFFTQTFPAYFDPNFVRNRVYRADRKLLASIKSSTAASVRSEVELAMKPHRELKTWTFDYALNPASAVTARLLIGRNVRIGELVTAMWVKTGYNRLLKLRVLLASHRVGDADIERYVAKSSAGLENPFDGRPMMWSPKQRVLWFAYRGCDTVTQVRLRGGRFFNDEELAALKKTYKDRCS